MTKFTKQAESLIVALNNDATGIASKLRKIHTEMYVIDPDKGQMEMTLNNLANTLSTMQEEVRGLLMQIVREEVKEKEETL